MKYAVIGTGAIGGYYGGRLAESGRDVQFLARSDAQYMKKEGLRVTSPKGNFHIRNIPVFTRIDEMKRVDVILVAMKTTANEGLADLIRPLAAPGTAILLMQNGLGMEDEVQRAFPECPVLGGMCFICSQKRKPGEITHMDYGALTIGAQTEAGRDVMARTVVDFEASRITVTLADDLGEARWRKLLWNIPYNGLTVLLNSDTKQIMDHPSSRAIIRSLMEEVVKGAAACGYSLEESEIDHMMAFTDKMTPYEPSMKLDYNNNRAMEVEYMYRRPLAAASAAGCELPYISMMARQLEYYDALRLKTHG